MFEEDIIKLKKEQFVEAESVAYLINDGLKRKLAFANTCCLFAFKNYIEKNKYKYEPVTNINLFRVPKIAEKYGISDLYLGDIRVDVRVSLDGKVFPIPKEHIINSLAADYYVVYKGTKNPLKCEGIGYVSRENLVFESKDDNYYYVSVAILTPLNEFKSEVNSFYKEEKTFYETEHRLAMENIGAFLDDDLDEVKSLDMLEHFLQCSECRKIFVEFSFLEDVLTSVNYYPDIKETVENAIEENEYKNANQSADINNETENIEKEVIIENSEEIFNTTDDEKLINEDTGLEEGELTLPEGLNSAEDVALTDESLSLNDGETEIIVQSNDENNEILSEEQDNEPEQTNNVSDSEPYEVGLVYEEYEEKDDETDNPEEIQVKLDTSSLPNQESVAEDEYLIKENNEEIFAGELNENFAINSDDIELNNFIIDDINETKLEGNSIDNNVETIELNYQTETDISNNDASDTIEFVEDESVNNKNDEINIQQENTTIELFDDDYAENSIENQNTAFEININDDEDNKIIDFNDELKDNQLDLNNNAPVDNIIINEKDNFQNNITDVSDTESDEEIQETISFEDIFADDEIDIQSNNLENIKNDEELNDILNSNIDIDNVGTNQDISSEWNEIYKTNFEERTKTVQNNESTEEITDIPISSSENENEEIKTLYDDVTNDAGADIEKTMEESPIQEKKPVNAAILITVILTLLAVVGIGGFSYVGINMANKAKNNNENMLKDSDLEENFKYNNMDRVMTDAFTDEQMQKLEISKMSWNKNKSSKMTDALKSYLNTSASSIWDDLDNSLQAPQGYIPNQPTKITIAVNKNGEIINVKISQSCGSKDIDEIILQSVKNVLNTMSPAAYSVKGENLNLTLVVNF